MKRIYEAPFIEVVECENEDILTTSSFNGEQKEVAGTASSDSYEDWYNATAGGKIRLD